MPSITEQVFCDNYLTTDKWSKNFITRVKAYVLASFPGSSPQWAWERGFIIMCILPNLIHVLHVWNGTQVIGPFLTTGHITRKHAKPCSYHHSQSIHPNSSCLGTRLVRTQVASLQAMALPLHCIQYCVLAFIIVCYFWECTGGRSSLHWVLSITMIKSINNQLQISYSILINNNCYA